mgnify:CR=1 FL=1
MAKVKTKADEYKEIFIKLHRYQRKGADNLILLLTRFVRAKAEYMTQYIDVVAERSGVSPTGHITTTNADIMLPIVREMIRIEEGLEPPHKLLAEAWEAFICEFRNHKIK